MKTSLAIIGTLWGDEGKGKVTDFYAKRANFVVRSQGGNNAGHTIVINKKKYALRLLPSGVYNDKINNVLSNGMVIDVEFLVEEIKKVEFNLKKMTNLFISERAHVVLPYHKELDIFYENQKVDKIGTTNNGIGPAYSEKYLRNGIRIIDFITPKTFKILLKQNLDYVNSLFNSFEYDVKYDFEKEYTRLTLIAKKLKKYVCDTSLLLLNAIDSNKKILFEGAQGTMLCVEHGTYPMVTSSSPSALAIPLNVGIPSKNIENVLGVTKAYVSKVGEGFFVTKIENNIANQIREVGHEFGTVTKRPRQIGWLDLFILRYVIRTTGITHLAITLLDVLSNIENLKVCIGYIKEGKKLNSFPSSQEVLKSCKPIYKELSGWTENISNISCYEDLPKNAKNYIEFIEKFLKINVVLISVGPDRSQTLERKKIF